VKIGQKFFVAKSLHYDRQMNHCRRDPLGRRPIVSGSQLATIQMEYRDLCRELITKDVRLNVHNNILEITKLLEMKLEGLLELIVDN
jgi:hypothetical protein